MIYTYMYYLINFMDLVATHNCPNGFIQLQCSCYFVARKSITYEQAIRECKMLTNDLGYLAEPRTQAINDLILNMAKKSSSDWNNYCYFNHSFLMLRFFLQKLTICPIH